MLTTNLKALHVGLDGMQDFYVGYIGETAFYSSTRNNITVWNNCLPLKQAIAKKGNSNYTWYGKTHTKFIKWLQENINNIPSKE